MILAREILTGDRLGATVWNGAIYMFGLLVVSVAWIGGQVCVIDHMGGRWTFKPDEAVRCLQRWNGVVPT